MEGHKIYLAAYHQNRYMLFKLQDYRYFLESYHYMNPLLVSRIRETGRRVFMDSGAFSAYNTGKDVSLKDYAQFLKDHEDIIEVASVLDGIGDPALTLDNQHRLEDLGCQVLPCFHYNEPWHYLEKYLEAGYPYIALGGMVPISAAQLEPWLDEIWDRYLTDKDGWPIVKVHGFGMTTLDLILKYPWHSVDSTSWMMTSNFGSVYWPTKANPAHKLAFSSKSPKAKDKGKHYLTRTDPEREYIDALVRMQGYDPDDLRDKYWVRDQWNIDYFKKLCDRPLEPFYRRQMVLF